MQLPGVPQDDEYCLLTMYGLTRPVRLHDYGPIFDIPGLYEYLFENLLRRSSPRIVVALRHRERYQHRLAVDGRSIYYVCLIGSVHGKPTLYELREE